MRAFKPLKILGHVFMKPMQRTVERNCIQSAVKEVGTRGTEHKPGTNENVRNAVKQHAETTGHD